MKSILGKLYQRVTSISLAAILAVSSLSVFGAALVPQKANAISLVTYKLTPSASSVTVEAGSGVAGSINVNGEYKGFIGGWNDLINGLQVGSLSASVTGGQVSLNGLSWDSSVSENISLLSRVNDTFYFRSSTVGTYDIDFEATAHVLGSTKHLSASATLNAVDTVAPTAPNITDPSEGEYFAGAPILNQWSTSYDAVGVNFYQIAYNYDDGHSFGGGSTCPGIIMPGHLGFIGCRDVSGTSRNHTPNVGEQGGVTIWVRATDNAGNVSDWSSPVHYYYDATAPVVTIDGVSPKPFYSDNTNISVHVSDTNYARTEIYHSGGLSPFKTYTGAWFGLFWLSDGGYHLTAIDSAGNETSHDFTIDTNAPIVGISAPNDGAAVSGTVDIRGSVTDEHLSHYYLRISDASDGTVYTKTVHTSEFTDQLLYNWDTAGVADGDYTIFLSARDLADNKDGSKTTPGVSVDSITVTVDHTAPAITVTGGDLIVEAGSTYTDQGATWIDAVDGSGDVTDITGAVDTSTPGIYTLTYTYTDAAGNTGTATRIVTVVDTTAPTVTLTGGDATLTEGDTYTEQGATWTDIVDGSGDVTDITGVVDTSTSGTYTVTYSYTDSVGNVGSATRTVTVEPAPAVLGDTTTATTTTNTPQGSTAAGSGTSLNEGSSGGSGAEVKGASVTENDTDAATNGVNAEESSSESNSDFLGLAWYWWLLILAAIGAGWWSLVAWMRRRSEQE